ncbi:MAG: Zn-dependent exopeptidase M28 [Oscillospiraceae bacterium]|nr:Zn-dependent exopeptidase M28 [Oscillospiraceae bacterium]
MKAQEAVRDFPSSLRECANFAKKGIEHICKKIGGRACGSSEERKAQEYMAEQMGKYADEVKLEDFKVAPYAFMGWILVDVVLVSAAALLYLINLPVLKILSLALVTVAILIVIIEFLFYKRFLDVVFPKKTSCNVIGRRKPEGEIKQRIVFSGHADSAMEWRFTYWGGPKLLISSIAVSFVGFVINLLVSALLAISEYTTQFISTGVSDVLIWVLIGWIPIYLFCSLFCRWGWYVQGANDNLTGCYGSIAVLKFLADNNIRFENTEVVAVTTGGEEAGLRGAKAYCEAHRSEDLAVDTLFIGLETLRDYEHMAIYKRDMTGTVANSQIACAIVKKGSELVGLDLKYESVFFGSSDAAAVSQSGIHATTLASMDPAPARYYHTRLDTWDNLDFRTLEKGIEVAIQTAFVFDEVGLNMPE